MWDHKLEPGEAVIGGGLIALVVLGLIAGALIMLHVL